MILAPDRSLIGYGVLGMHSYQAQSGFLEVGNSNEVKLQHSNEKKSVPNYRTGVGNNNSKSRITEITGSFTLYDWTPASLAVALNAKPRGVVAGTVPDEPHPPRACMASTSSSTTCRMSIGSGTVSGAIPKAATTPKKGIAARRSGQRLVR